MTGTTEHVCVVVIRDAPKAAYQMLYKGELREVLFPGERHTADEQIKRLRAMYISY